MFAESTVQISPAIRAVEADSPRHMMYGVAANNAPRDTETSADPLTLAKTLDPSERRRRAVVLDVPATHATPVSVRVITLDPSTNANAHLSDVCGPRCLHTTVLSLVVPLIVVPHVGADPPDVPDVEHTKTIPATLILAPTA